MKLHASAKTPGGHPVGYFGPNGYTIFGLVSKTKRTSLADWKEFQLSCWKLCGVRVPNSQRPDKFRRSVCQ